MKKLLLFILILTSLAAAGQQRHPFGTPKGYNALAGTTILDTLLFLPVRDTVEWNDASFRKLGRFTVRPQDRKLYYHDNGKWTAILTVNDSAFILQVANTSGQFIRWTDTSGQIPTRTWVANNTVPPSRTVNGHPLSANVTVTKADVGLGNVDNTSDANKPISWLQQAALDMKANVADMSQSISTSTTLYPSVNAVKSFVEASIAAISYEVPLTFTNGLTRTSNTVRNDLITGVVGNQQILGSTIANGVLSFRPTNATGSTSTNVAYQFWADNASTHAMSIFYNGRIIAGNSYDAAGAGQTFTIRENTSAGTSAGLNLRNLATSTNSFTGVSFGNATSFQRAWVGFSGSAGVSSLHAGISDALFLANTTSNAGILAHVAAAGNYRLYANSVLKYWYNGSTDRYIWNSSTDNGAMYQFNSGLADFRSVNANVIEFQSSGAINGYRGKLLQTSGAATLGVANSSGTNIESGITVSGGIRTVTFQNVTDVNFGDASFRENRLRSSVGTGGTATTRVHWDMLGTGTTLAGNVTNNTFMRLGEGTTMTASSNATWLEVAGIYNFTSFSGVARGIHINNTVTAMASGEYRALDITPNIGYAIYQSGSSAINRLNGAVQLQNVLNLQPISEPAAPATGGVLYHDLADGKLKYKKFDGSITIIVP